MTKKNLISAYIQEVYRFDLITIKKITKLLIDESQNVVINTICKYSLYDLIYVLDIDLEQLTSYCNNNTIETILLDNIKDFETELLFYYLIKNNFRFSSGFRGKILEIDYNNSILHYFVDNRKDKIEGDILNIVKIKNRLNSVIKTNKDGKSIDK